jgi:Skp family chaperone for outer membrane proteins
MADMPEPYFEVPQYYETLVEMRSVVADVDRDFRFLCVPISAINEDNRDLLENPTVLLSEVLELGESKPLRVAQLPDAIFTLLTLEILDEEARRNSSSVLELVSDGQWLDGRREADPDGALFAEYLAFEDVVPFELSEPRFHPLTKTAMESYKTAGGLLEDSPQAAIVHPKGPVVFIAAAGAVAIIDSVGVIVGVAISPITRQVIEKVRNGFKKLISRLKRRPKAGPPAVAIPLEQLLKDLPPEEKERLLAELEAETRKLKAQQHAEAEKLRAEQEANRQQLLADQKAERRKAEADLHAIVREKQDALNKLARKKRAPKPDGPSKDP